MKAAVPQWQRALACLEAKRGEIVSYEEMARAVYGNERPPLSFRYSGAHVLASQLRKAGYKVYSVTGKGFRLEKAS